MRTARRGVAANEIQYLVLHDDSHPILLARVGWPDVFHAISPARPEWQSDPGLLDLPYDPSSVVVTPDSAAAIAAEGVTADGRAETDTIHYPIVEAIAANDPDAARSAIRRHFEIHSLITLDTAKEGTP